MKHMLVYSAFTIGFFLGGMLINLLILNRPEAVYIAEGLVTCKNNGGLAYLPLTGINAKCKDGSVLERVEGPEVTKYYLYIKDKQVLGVNYMDFINFDYAVMNK